MKPPRRWLAVVLNLIFPPVGYVYLGALRAAGLFVLAVAVAAVGAVTWTLNSPPGIYDLGPWAEGSPEPMLFAALVGLAAAIHVAFLKPPARRPTGWRFWVIAVGFWLTPLVLAGLARAFSPVAFYSVASASNAPTLAEGDIVAARGARASCGRTTARAGDLVIYRQPNDATRYLHRIVAEAGQSVEVRDGRLIIDGEPVVVTPTGKTYSVPWGQAGVLRETLPDGTSHDIVDLSPDSDADTFAPITVPAGSVFILGDNRDNALDSRFKGAVALSDVCGVAFKVVRAEDRDRIGQRP